MVREVPHTELKDSVQGQNQTKVEDSEDKTKNRKEEKVIEKRTNTEDQEDDKTEQELDIKKCFDDYCAIGYEKILKHGTFLSRKHIWQAWFYKGFRKPS